MQKCKKNVLWKDSVASFWLNGIERCIKLSDQLKTGKYKAAPPKKFTITSPKKREVVSVAFRDRVYQRSLADQIVYPCMTKPLLNSNCACQKGKGTDYARNLLKRYVREAYQKHGLDAYVLKIDVKGYYLNIPHKQAEERFKRYLPEWAAKRAVNILQGQYSGDTGYYAGSQLVQIVGVSYMNHIDHYVKEKLGIKWYIAYQDDSILIHHDKAYLTKCLSDITAMLTDLGLKPHPDKTKITPFSKGIEFLGFTFKPTETGKVLMLINSDNVKKRRKTLYRAAKKLPEQKLDEMQQAWIAHVAKGNTYHLQERMDEYIKQVKENAYAISQEHDAD